MSNGLFKKFSKEAIITQSLTKGSQQRQIRKKLQDQFPTVTADEWDDIIPKKETLTAVKCQNHVTLIVLSTGHILFFQERDGPYMPTLKLLHAYPWMLPRMQVDIGGCKFVIGGANVMCPGLTHPTGGYMDDVEKNGVAAIYVDGKRHAVAIGRMLMSTAEIRAVNKGHGIENVHFLGDGLWTTPSVAD
eukprot:TRINITY_DN53869_c0_g1_i1.p1 TRINITY_DN53869_c0_g1~~TRINITY_DN53869_c0_g1_i1.p1  ORF type:complete len:197 (+),score=37.99 TRINITY_DN53869_c0_g1_i1:25-591(+)